MINGVQAKAAARPAKVGIRHSCGQIGKRPHRPPIAAERIGLAKEHQAFARTTRSSVKMPRPGPNPICDKGFRSRILGCAADRDDRPDQGDSFAGGLAGMLWYALRPDKTARWTS